MSDDWNAEVGATTVVVAHDSHQQRRRVVAALDSAPDLTVVGEAAEGEEARRLIGDLVPDVAVLAVGLPKIDPVALCSEVHLSLPLVRVLLVSEQDDERSFEAARTGARGLLLLPADDVQVTWAVRRVARGEGLLTPAWARAVLAELDVDEKGPVVPNRPRIDLSPTELEVVRRVARGATPDAIARLHEVSTRLVNLHAGYTLKRLSRAEDDARTTGRST